jgi:hypothetical protein
MGLIINIFRILLGKKPKVKRKPKEERLQEEEREPEQMEEHQETFEEEYKEEKPETNLPVAEKKDDEYHETFNEEYQEEEIRTETQSHKKTKPAVMEQKTYDSEVFPADEPIIVYLTEFLSDRLQQMVKKDHSAVKVPPMHDWTGCGYALSENFSEFINEVNDKLQETALLDNLLSQSDSTRKVTSEPQPGAMLHREEIAMAERKLQSARRILKTTLTNDEKWVLLITLVPHIYPHYFDEVIAKHIQKPGEYPQMGFTRGRDFRGYCPTGETIFFLLAGNDFDRRIELQRLFQADHIFSKKKIVWLEDMGKGEPIMSGKLVIAQDHLDKIMFGEVVPPDFSLSFPAKQVETQLSWDDLVISSELQEQISMILSWVFYNEELMVKMGMKKRLKKGYRTLFYGPPGTGKTLTAGLLGNITNRPVYRIDLSMVVSKYIGETEKNLEQLFARAEDKGWILFFDEADAIFGKRTGIRDAHDKYANQEVSYLLQRIEDYNGLIIMATNMRSNIDESFIRRFNSMLRFPFPDEENRARIWERALPGDVPWRGQSPQPPYHLTEEKEVDIPQEVKKYELSGGNIVNVIHYAALKAAEVYNQQKKYLKSKAAVAEPVPAEGEECEEPSEHEGEEPVLAIYLSDVMDGIRRELIKEGKPFAL